MLSPSPNLHKRSSYFLTLSIVAFLALDATMLWLNFTITRTVSADALVINLAGRQRMLSQRMAKTLFLAEVTDQSSVRNEAFDDFFAAYGLFSETLAGFEQGGSVLDAESNRVDIEPILIEEVVSDLVAARTLMEPIDRLVNALSQNPFDPALIRALSDELIATNDQLLDLMNQITVSVEKRSRDKTAELRLIQLLTFMLALFSFAYIIKLFRERSRQSEALVETLNELFQGTRVALLMFDENNRLVSSNQAASELFGCSLSGEAEYWYHEMFLINKGVTKAIHAQSGSKVEVERHERTLMRDGEKLRVVTVVDISHHLERQRSLSQAAQRDALTGVYNRNALTQYLARLSDDQRQPQARFALFFLDLDEFKQVNDQYGHDAGDLLLTQFARRLITVLRETDRAYRYGGDEFVVVADLPNDDQPIERIIEKISAVAREPVSLGEIQYKIRMSIGVAIYPDEESDIQTLLNRADQRMYRAKRSGSVAIVRDE